MPKGGDPDVPKGHFVASVAVSLLCCDQTRAALKVDTGGGFP